MDDVIQLTKRERDVLSTAVKFGWDVIVNGRGVAQWDGDALMPFRAFKTLDVLIDRGYFERVTYMRAEWYRATRKARDLKCSHCQDGRTYAEDEATGYDAPTGICESCGGTCLKPNTDDQRDAAPGVDNG